MSTSNKDFKVKYGLQVANGATFGDPISVGEPTENGHASTKSYVDTNFIPEAEKAAFNGVATLDEFGNIPIGQLGNIIDGAPEILNTLAEISNAINDDQNFAVSVATSVTNGVAESKSYADGLISTEVSERNTAIAAGIDIATGDAAIYTDQQISTESQNRFNAINDAITEEVSNRNIAIGDAISAEHELTVTAIGNVESLITDEVTNRQNAINALTTSDIEEGTNKYFTNERAVTANSGLYDTIGAAQSAQNAAYSYADSLANNYDPAGSASQAETNANAYTDEVVAGIVIGALPDQTGNAGKFLETNGTDASWQTIDVSGQIDAHNSDTTNVHGIADTSLLATTTDLDLKQDKVSGVSNTEIGYLDGVTSAIQDQIDEKASISHGHSISDVADLSLTLSGKADVAHSHIISDVTGLQTELDSKTDIGHSHSISDITNLQTTIDDINSDISGKADTVHSHIVSDITGLSTELDGKADLSGDTFTGDVVISSTTPATSSTSGALVVNGGIGTGGNLHAEGTAYFGSPTTLNLSNPVAFFTEDVDDYIQIGLQNTNSGSSASADIVITADNGTNSSNFIDMGIASSTYDYPDYSAIKPNDAYVIVDGGDLNLNTTTGGKKINFVVGGAQTTDTVGEWSETSLTVNNDLTVSGAVNLDSTLDVTGAITANDIDVASHINYTPIAGSLTPTWSEGNIYYDSEEKTIVLQGAGSGNFEISMGQREWVRTRNTSGATIPKGTPVYVTGVHIPGDPTHGHHPTIAPALASDKTKRDVIGITGESIANGAHGYTVVRGYIEGINTSNLTSGARVHLSAEVAGGLVTDAPGYPNYPVELGTCLTSDATLGTLYVNLASQSVEQFRVDNDAYVDGNLTVAGDFTIIGNQSSVSVANLNVDNNFIYLNSGDSIGSSNTTFSGTGVNDGVFIGHYEGATTKTFKVKITINGSGSNPDSFRWSTDDFVTDNGTDIQLTDGLSYELSDGISIRFVSDNGHIVNDTWTGIASPISVDIALIGNRNTGATGVGYTHLGMFYDITDDKFKFFSEYAPEPEGNIDTGDASFTYGVVKASAFEGNLTGNVTGSISGNAGTVTNGVYTTDTATVTNNMLAGSIADSKLSTISTAGKVANSATTATQANTANTIVARDASGNFTANIISANLSGNADTATNATNATNATKSAITEDTTTNGTKYLTWVDANTGNNPVKTTSTKLTFNPSTGVLSSTGFSGSLAGNASSVTNGVYTTDTGTVTNTMLAGSIANSKLANYTVTINGTAVALGGSITIDALPSQTGNAGKYLTTNGSVASWASLNATPAYNDLSDVEITSAAANDVVYFDGNSWVNKYVSAIPTSTNAPTVVTNNYTLQLSDAGKIVELNNSATAMTLSIPTHSSVAYPVGTQITLLQTGTGQVTVQAVTPGTTTVNSTPGLKLRAQWSSAILLKRANDVWVLMGDTSA